MVLKSTQITDLLYLIWIVDKTNGMQAPTTPRPPNQQQQQQQLKHTFTYVPIGDFPLFTTIPTEFQQKSHSDQHIKYAAMGSVWCAKGSRGESRVRPVLESRGANARDNRRGRTSGACVSSEFKMKMPVSQSTFGILLFWNRVCKVYWFFFLLSVSLSTSVQRWFVSLSVHYNNNTEM